MQKKLDYYFSQPLSDKNFHHIYQLSATQLYGVILRILRQEQLSQDCLQEVFVKIYHNLSGYNADKSQPLTWMVTIARNHAIDFYRKKNLQIANDFDLSVIDDEQIQTLNKLEQQTNQHLHDCLQQLKPEIMNVLLLSYFKGMTYQTIAKTLNTPLNTIKAWVHRAMPTLRTCLEKIND